MIATLLGGFATSPWGRAAPRYNAQDVLLKLRTRIGKTSHFADYASHRFHLRRGITTDFDF